MTGFVPLYDSIGCIDPQKYDIEFWFLVGDISSSISVAVLWVTCFVDQICFRFWSRWTMVVVMDLSRY